MQVRIPPGVPRRSPHRPTGRASGLKIRPVPVQIRVRVPIHSGRHAPAGKHARVGQRVESPASEAGCWRFESSRAHQWAPFPPAGCNPADYETRGAGVVRFNSSGAHHFHSRHNATSEKVVGLANGTAGSCRSLDYTGRRHSLSPRFRNARSRRTAEAQAHLTVPHNRPVPRQDRRRFQDGGRARDEKRHHNRGSR